MGEVERVEKRLRSKEMKVKEVIGNRIEKRSEKSKLFFYEDTTTTEIYTSLFVGSVGCV